MVIDEQSTEMSAFGGTRGSYAKMTKTQHLCIKVSTAYSDDIPVNSHLGNASFALMIDFMDLQVLMHITVFDKCSPINIVLP